MTRNALLGLILMGLPAIARGELLVAPSLQWLADHCVDSGVYVVTAMNKAKQGSGTELTLALKTRLRGNPVARAHQYYYRLRLSDPKRPLVKAGDEFLLCFQHYSTGEKRAIQTINLDHPQAAGYALIAATCNLELLTKKADILKVFQARLRSHPKADPVEISDYSKDNRFELGSHTPLYAAVYGGSTCYLGGSA
ncbi:MAG: hypothetical protein OER86_12585, partial [Phycisphaerae bacterium]|nr:hypothetical protein [Phycisphaerae bacterium]